MNNQDQKTAITLAQWCAYLPYDVKLSNEKRDYQFIMQSDIIEACVNHDDSVGYQYSTYKPLLRPMNKENEVSIDMLLRLHQGEDDNNFLFFHNGNLFSTPDENSPYVTYEYMPYKYIQVLLSNHYDIFNLIPQGLALPIE